MRTNAPHEVRMLGVEDVRETKEQLAFKSGHNRNVAPS
jgi:hypothetical protein